MPGELSKQLLIKKNDVKKVEAQDFSEIMKDVSVKNKRKFERKHGHGN